MVTNKSNAWTALSAIIGLLTLLCAIYSISERQDNDVGCTVFFCDEKGHPKTDIVLLFPDGFKVEPNSDGIVILPESRGGKAASVRSVATRREIRAIVTPQPHSQVYRIHL